MPNRSGELIGAMGGTALFALDSLPRLRGARLWTDTALYSVYRQCGRLFQNSAIPGNAGKLAWGALYGLGFGAGIGASLFAVQAESESSNSGRGHALIGVSRGPEGPRPFTQFRGNQRQTPASTPFPFVKEGASGRKRAVPAARHSSAKDHELGSSTLPKDTIAAASARTDRSHTDAANGSLASKASTNTRVVETGRQSRDGDVVVADGIPAASGSPANVP